MADDFADVDEVGEDPVDLEGRGIGALLVECGDGEVAGTFGYDTADVISEETTVQGVGTVVEEILALEVVFAEHGDVGHAGILGESGRSIELWILVVFGVGVFCGFGRLGRGTLDFEDESGGKVVLPVLGLREQETVGIKRMRGEEEMAGGEGREVVGFFQDAGAGVAATYSVVANKETGDVAFEQALVEVSKQGAEALVGPTRST